MISENFFGMLGHYLEPSVTKKVICYSLVHTQQPFVALQKQSSHWIFQYTIKSLETFLIWNYFCNNANKYKLIKIKKGTIIDLTTDSLIEKY